MNILTARNVQTLLPEVVQLLAAAGERRESRNGPVRVMNMPVTTLYEQPAERVLYWPQRDANPFFHLFESLWMLAGRDDIKPLARYVPRMTSFSDDGGRTMPGAYGARWRRHFGGDQISQVIEALRKNRDDRRQVIDIWDGACDLTRASYSKDAPCNLTITMQVNLGGELDMCVFNRSNDIIWGAYGANVVHMSVLQEFVARAVGVPLGGYWQISANWHGYETVLMPLSDALGERDQSMDEDPYQEGRVEPYPLMQSCNYQRWFVELQNFMAWHESTNPGWERSTSADDMDKVMPVDTDPFFTEVAMPMTRAYAAYKRERAAGDHGAAFDLAQLELERCKASDWALAARQWIYRRRNAYKQAQDDGPQAVQEVGIEEVRP